MANVWMHNGFLQVEGEKMSKSLGNFVTIKDALDQFPTDPRWGEVLRLNMLKTHYRQPLDWTQSSMAETLATYSEFRQVVMRADRDKAVISRELIEALEDDLNTPAALTVLHRLAKSARTDTDAENELVGSLRFLGFDRAIDHVKAGDDVRQDVESAYQEVSARELGLDPDLINSLKDARLAARKAKNWAESDRIRDELAAMGIQLKDGKDPQTGEAITTWEVKR
jgi:cysteinyl-tRNA synthetase